MTENEETIDLRKVKDIAIEAAYLAGELIEKAFYLSKDLTTKEG
jgi:hypothetical protein